MLFTTFKEFLNNLTDEGIKNLTQFISSYKLLTELEEQNLNGNVSAKFIYKYIWETQKQTNLSNEKMPNIYFLFQHIILQEGCNRWLNNKFDLYALKRKGEDYLKISLKHYYKSINEMYQKSNYKIQEELNDFFKLNEIEFYISTDIELDSLNCWVNFTEYMECANRDKNPIITKFKLRTKYFFWLVEFYATLNTKLI